MTQIVRKAVVGVLAMAALVPNAASGAPPPQREKIETIQSSTLRGDAAQDVVLNDGLGAYLASEMAASYVRNLIPSVADGDSNTQNQDRLFVMTEAGGSRRMPFSSDLASAAHFGPGSTQSIDCLTTHILFESASTPDWYEALGSVGDTVKGWGNVRCYTTPDSGYQAFYKSTASATSAAECLQMTRVTSTALVLSAPAGTALDPFGGLPCNADIHSFAYSTDENGQRTGFRSFPLGSESAPYELTVDLGNGKGKKHS